MQKGWNQYFAVWNSVSKNALLSSPVRPIRFQIHAPKDAEQTPYFLPEWVLADERAGDLLPVQTKGSRHTLQMLIEARSEEECAAVWIYSVAKTMLDENRRLQKGSGYRLPECAAMILDDFCRAARPFLAARFSLWHPAMRRLIPYRPLLFPSCWPKGVQSAPALMHIVVANADMVLHQCTARLYTSLDGYQCPAALTLRKACASVES